MKFSILSETSFIGSPLPIQQPTSLRSDYSAPKPSPAATGPAIRTGQQVFHVKFGEGRVLAVEGSGDDARAQVNFPRHGVKWLALAIAKLTVVD